MGFIDDHGNDNTNRKRLGSLYNLHDAIIFNNCLDPFYSFYFFTYIDFVLQKMFCILSR